MPLTTDNRQPSTLAARYALPDELADFIRAGFLHVLAEDEPHKTLRLHIPALRSTDLEGPHQHVRDRLDPALQYLTFAQE